MTFLDIAELVFITIVVLIAIVSMTYVIKNDK